MTSHPHPVARSSGSLLVLVTLLGVTGCGDSANPGGDGGANNQNVAQCGNGEVEAAEECDEGAANSDVAPDACRTDCRAAHCGDAVRDDGEDCDEGPENSDAAPDACRTTCRAAHCGDGVVDEVAGEQCDDGNLTGGDGCGATCRVEFCGNGVVDPGEACDDGNLAVGDGCTPDCQSDESCGNARPDFAAGETCDCGTDPAHLPVGCPAENGAVGSPCSADCQSRFCGNDVINAGEVCDDGNSAAGDGCSPDCRSDESCGNGVPDFAVGETCDCGTDPAHLPTGCAAVNGQPGSPCTAACRSKFCGNGVVNAGEVCDDGNTLAGDGCSPDCRSDESCGNGYIDVARGEACDCGTDPAHLPASCTAPNGDPRSSCSDTCTERYCGNHVLDPGEVCDDGNTVAGDGCSPDCRSNEACGNGYPDFARGETCDCGTDASALPEGCLAPNGHPDGACGDDCLVRFCGNGLLDPGEVCDDGNTLAGDGCSADCRSDESCGNGYVDAVTGETCDDGNTLSGDGCQATCRLPRCGDLVVDADEACDDGNTVAGDGCSADCLSDESCGNGHLDGGLGEECDDGNATAGDGCSSTCLVERCGNLHLDPGEACDDGNTLSGDGCSADCLSDESCGNGIVDVAAGEACDDGNATWGDACQPTCALPTCGDGVLDPGEVCDDGGTESGDGCNAQCTSDESCGNGTVDVAAGEQCDDGNATAGDGCSAGCQVEYCGNGTLDPGEACDDGNTTSGDGCSGDCRSTEGCGNGIVDVAAGERCDDGNALAGDGCSPACRLEYCGNGELDPGEACDDGNTDPGDGCSPDCHSDETCGNAWPDFARGETCDCGTDAAHLPPGCAAPNGAAQSPCTADCQTRYCGNGVINAGEVCDDGNTTSGDGCSPDCRSIETCGNGYVDSALGETCDDGNTTPGDGCSATCRSEYCGNGVREGTEVCDDGDTLSGDGCSSDCRSLETCGNLYIDLARGEQCDDGNTTPGDGCSATCQTETCGNGVLNGGEICDDGNTRSGDGCSADCRSLEVCGNRYVDVAIGEQCDDGNTSPGDGCSATCRLEHCGNGRPDGAEICDDGNNLSGDGCSADCLSDETCGNGYLDAAAGEECDDGNLASHDGCSSGCTLELLGWTDLTPTQPYLPTGFAVAQDTHRNRTVVFGGSCGWMCDSADTWEHDGVGWVRVPTTGAPTHQTSGTLVYDSSRRRMVFVGIGRSSSGPVETWEYDGAAWTEISPAFSPPTVGPLAFDSYRQRVVLLSNLETWEYDGVAWARRHPVRSPTTRTETALAYDATRHRVVLFGGRLSASQEALSDTWEYDGITWVKVALTGPPGRSGHGLTYDTQRSRIVLQGGATFIKYPPFGDLAQAALFDTWEYDGTTWVERSPAPAGPPAAYPVALLYDPARQRVRRLGLSSFPDLWEYDGTRWEEYEGWPSGMEGPALAYDEHRRRLVALYPDLEYFGLGTLPPCQTLEHDGRRWHRVRTAFTPENRSGHALVYDAGRRRTVLFGGYYNLADTWEYDGVAWQRRAPTTSPSGRDSHAMAYDRARGQVVLFGGRTRVSGSDVLLADTWTYDGTTWTQVTPAHTPTKRYRAAMAYDEVRGRLVLYGGAGTEYGPFYSDTWEWSGTDWIGLGPAQAPPARAGAGLAYDAAAQRMILFGGSKLNFTFGDTWLWDGTGWQEADPPWAPPARTRAGLAYHGVLGAVVLLGGSPYDGAGTVNRDLWVYRSGSTWPEEVCDSAEDRDLDGVVGCADPDCAGQRCAPGQECQSGACVGYCGNGSCDAGETAVSCPQDCNSGVCGDHACTGAETAWSCPGDCGGTGYCGDGTCSSTESPWRCPADCPLGCGDGLCNGDEDDASCMADCVVCGNYACEMGESKTTCFEDCSLPQCPNGTCNSSEDHEVCPIDCPTVCGDGRCHREEIGATCPTDCGLFAGSCGDAVCSPGEDEWFCPADCVGQGYCGDAVCDPSESRFTCLEDCPPFCGDTVCDDDESKATCPVDCPAVCGDHDCDPGESSMTCPGDCPPICGNGVCETGETMTCPMDCAVCGNLICEPGETMTCPMDCAPPAFCGNFLCEPPTETHFTCPGDCP